MLLNITQYFLKTKKDKTLCWNISLETWHKKNYFYFARTHFREKNDMVDFSNRLSEITIKLKVPKSQFVYGIMLDHKAYQRPQQQQKSAHKPKNKLGAWIDWYGIGGHKTYVQGHVNRIAKGYLRVCLHKIWVPCFLTAAPNRILKFLTFLNWIWTENSYLKYRP